ncbi:hypothetical protein [Aeromonas schubertii]|uniref:hypothetical protein n=1 Tax=Aeromonas schubertii TaxID=652 RepID=UPI001CC3D90E|nr:hypothetical protein [Aeromonas schubertii]EKP0308559.1 hypothetical protein [Aeromonas veronii]MBZ6071588.1 hypothetical protein [Aeromonas schubertii]
MITALKTWGRRLALLLVSVGLVGLFTRGAVIYPAEGKSLASTHPAIMLLLDSPLFMGVITLITLYVLLYTLYLLWQLHEVAVHKAKLAESAHITLVFALSLCGLFIDKTWWVLAIIIAFGRWDLISERLSHIISRGLQSRATGEKA